VLCKSFEVSLTPTPLADTFPKMAIDKIRDFSSAFSSSSLIMG
jgi:hypothetical protein